MPDLTIGEVARRTGVPASALRFYEKAGVLPRTPRINGRRRYGEDVVDLVQVARFAQSVGFSLAEIRGLLGAVASGGGLRRQWKPLAKAKLRELDVVIEKARQMKAAIEHGLECGCLRIEDCLPPKRRR